MSSVEPDMFESAIVALKEAIALDAAPVGVLDAARATFTWRTIDVELAALSFDSLDTGELVGARGNAGPRSLSFEFESVAIEAEAASIGGRFTIEGQVSPGTITRVEIHHADDPDPIVASLGNHGRFGCADVAPGHIRLMINFAVGAGPAMLLTEWVSL